MSMGQGTRSRLVRRDVLELQTRQFYFAPGDTNVFTGPTRCLAIARFAFRPRRRPLQRKSAVCGLNSRRPLSRQGSGVLSI
jgi:hypothetical protein